LAEIVLSRLNLFRCRASMVIAFCRPCICRCFWGFTLGFLAGPHFSGACRARSCPEVYHAQARRLPFMIIASLVLAISRPAHWTRLQFPHGWFYGWEADSRVFPEDWQSLPDRNEDIALRCVILAATPFTDLFRGISCQYCLDADRIADVECSRVIVRLESGLSFLGLGVQPPMTSLGKIGRLMAVT